MRWGWAVMLLLAGPVEAQWVPPTSVPAPTFGIAEVVPPPTVWVDATSGDDANAGTAAKPRRTIPRTLTAGMSVLVTGVQTQDYSSPNTLLCQGTAASPVFITGGAYTIGGEISGSYCILEPLGPGGWVVRDQRSGGPTDHIAIRHARGKAHFAVASFGSATVSNVVLYDNVGCGTYDGTQVETGGDDHGVTVGRNTGPTWLVDSNFSHCSGDGIQINGGLGGAALTGPTYVGRNVFDTNRQSGIGIKESHATLISDNTISNMRHDRDFTNPGACSVAQYFAISLVYLNNVCRHADNGFVVASYSDAGALAALGTTVVAFGANILSDIHSTGVAYNPADPWSPGRAFKLVGGSQRILKDNVGFDLDGAIGVVYPQVDGLPYVDLGGNVLTLGTASPAAPTSLRVLP